MVGNEITKEDFKQSYDILDKADQVISLNRINKKKYLEHKELLNDWKPKQGIKKPRKSRRVARRFKKSRLTPLQLLELQTISKLTRMSLQVFSMKKETNTIIEQLKKEKNVIK